MLVEKGWKLEMNTKVSASFGTENSLRLSLNTPNCTFLLELKLTTSKTESHRLDSFLSRCISWACKPCSRYDCSCLPGNVPGPYTARAQIGGTFSCRIHCTHRTSTRHSVCQWSGHRTLHKLKIKTYNSILFLCRVCILQARKRFCSLLFR